MECITYKSEYNLCVAKCFFPHLTTPQFCLGWQHYNNINGCHIFRLSYLLSYVTVTPATGPVSQPRNRKET